MSVHDIAVGVLALFAVVFAWRNAVELFIVWYSGVEPPFTKGQITHRATSAVIALAAAVAAVATL